MAAGEYLGPDIIDFIKNIKAAQREQATQAQGTLSSTEKNW